MRSRVFGCASQNSGSHIRRKRKRDIVTDVPQKRYHNNDILLEPGVCVIVVGPDSKLQNLNDGRLTYKTLKKLLFIGSKPFPYFAKVPSVLWWNDTEQCGEAIPGSHSLDAEVNK
jgi:hypothetical protein